MTKNTLIHLTLILTNDVDNPTSVADPGFPRGEGANPKGGANLLFGQLFPKTA